LHHIHLHAHSQVSTLIISGAISLFRKFTVKAWRKSVSKLEL
jgi:hypothetical protein